MLSELDKGGSRDSLAGSGPKAGANQDWSPRSLVRQRVEVRMGGTCLRWSWLCDTVRRSKLTSSNQPSLKSLSGIIYEIALGEKDRYMRKGRFENNVRKTSSITIKTDRIKHMQVKCKN